MKKTLLAAGFLLGTATATQAQTFPAAWGARMQAVLDSVNTVNQNGLGVNAAVYVPGYGLWKGAAGISSPGVPITTDMRMFIGSNSKLFVAVTMLKLQEQGVLNLDDHIGKWIHYGPTTVDTTATIRQLLSHESGMSDFSNDRTDNFWNLVYADTSRVFTARTMVDSSGAPVYPKGRGYHYSNDAYALCTMIVEAATGQTYWQNLRSVVLNPLTLDSTFVPVKEPYQPISGSNAYGDLYSGIGYTSFATAFPGAGDVVSTPAEMVQWYQSIFNSSFLSPTSKQQLLTFEPSSLYSLGLTDIVSPRLGDEYYHSGSVGAFNSEAGFDQDTKASFFIAINTAFDSLTTSQYLAPLLDVFTKEMPKRANDASITALTSPTGITCNPSVTPVVALKNNGSSNLTATTILVQVGTTVAATYNWTGTLAPGATTAVTLPATPISNGMHNVKIYTTQPNGVTDGYPWNDTFSTRLGANLTTAYNGYFSEGFEGQTTPVLIWNTRNGKSGQAGVSHLTGYNSMHSLVRANLINNGDYRNVSNVDMPAVNLSAGTSSVLSFRYAYKVNPGGQGIDSLEALISTDCGTTWTSLFYKGGGDLSGNDSTDMLYYPQTASEWKTQTIPLSAYSGNALIRFRIYNGNSNNIYLDDLAIGTPTAVANQNASSVLHMYPNPTTNQVTLTGLPERTRVTLADITGKTLMETEVAGTRTLLEVGHLTPGIYLVNTSLGTKKLVKN
ncbi:MAG: T9SS type A sorting domain-containing protein [Sphingobacteriales bacterium]|nr:MAG: T9SS type A sorting domain-containing protein [Sphingobacteriales bacterium]